MTKRMLSPDRRQDRVEPCPIDPPAGGERPLHLYDLRHNVDHDDWELGVRAAAGLYAENAGASPFEIICHRVHLAHGRWRLKTGAWVNRSVDNILKERALQWPR